MKTGTRWLTIVAIAMMFSSTAFAQETVNVTFRIDMSALIDSCQYMEARGDTIAVRGDFNKWSDEGVWTILEDTGENNIYAATIQIPADSTFGYKFWTNRVQWEEIDNRPYTVTEEAEQVLPIATYQKTFANICGADMETLLVEFSVNMETYIRAGDFDPENDVVDVRGDLNNWTGGVNVLESDPFNASIYSTLVEVSDFAVPGEIQFKFAINDDGWEGGSNRRLQVSGNEDRDDQNRLLIGLDPIPYFNRVPPTMLFSQETTLTLRVDARPAFYFLADSGYVPSDVQTSEELDDFTSVFITGPMMQAIDGGEPWPWGPTALGAMENRRLTASAENDSIFIFTHTFPENARRQHVAKFSLDGYDNEAGVGADHDILIPDEAEATVDVIFGSMADNDGHRLYWPYIFVDANENVRVRRRPGALSVEPIGGELPNTIALDQNYPNPFNPTTTFEYRLDAAQHVSLRVFDVLGREVAMLVDEVQHPNNYRVAFDAGNLPSGTYLYQLRAGSQVVTRTMTLLK